MTAIPLALAFALAVQAAPSVAPDTIVTFAKAESGLDPLVLHDNTSGRSYWPATQAEAVALASDLIVRKGHSVDLGIMQINSFNLLRVSMSIRDAFIPSISMRAGAAILSDAYRSCDGEAARTRQERAVALRCASSLYNTGNKTAGVRNGYFANIVRVAAQVVPSVGELATNFPGAAIDTSRGQVDRRQSGTMPDVTEVSPKPDCNARPEDVWGQAACREATLHTDLKGSDQP